MLWVCETGENRRINGISALLMLLTQEDITLRNVMPATDGGVTAAYRRRNHLQQMLLKQGRFHSGARGPRPPKPHSQRSGPHCLPQTAGAKTTRFEAATQNSGFNFQHTVSYISVLICLEKPGYIVAYLLKRHNYR